MVDEKSKNENESNRMSKTEYYLEIALAVSKRSTCLKRRYGAVIVNNDEIISTGYNGNPRGEQNCCDRGMRTRSGFRPIASRQLAYNSVISMQVPR